MPQARINIIEPNGVRRAMPLGNRPLIVGRDPECDVSLGYEAASRRHTQLGFDGQNYYVIDLNSTNGTFLGNSQLEPNTPTIWPLNVPVRIGEIFIHLDFSEARTNEIAPSSSNYNYAEADEPGNNLFKILAAVFVGILLLCGCVGFAALLIYALFF